MEHENSVHCCENAVGCLLFHRWISSHRFIQYFSPKDESCCHLPLAIDALNLKRLSVTYLKGGLSALFNSKSTSLEHAVGCLLFHWGISSHRFIKYFSPKDESCFYLTLAIDASSSFYDPFERSLTSLLSSRESTTTSLEHAVGFFLHKTVILQCYAWFYSLTDNG